MTVTTVLLSLGCNDVVLTPPIGVPSPEKLEPRATLVRGNELRQLIEGAADGATINLSGEYTVDAPIVIQDKERLKILGDGNPNTRILTTSNFSGLGVFQIGSDVDSLRMQGFAFKGTEPDAAQTNLYAVFTSGSTPPTNIRNMTFERLVIEDMGNGITIGGFPAGGCYGVTIYGNRIARMSARLVDEVDKDGPVKSTTGSGYGIHTQFCENVWIAKNHLEQMDRHAIYVADGRGPVKVEHNLMLNHFVGQVSCGYRNFDPSQLNECNQLTALHIARSQNVYAAFNLIVNPHTDAMTIYFDDKNPNEAITGVKLIGNVVMGRRPTGFPVRLGQPAPPTKDIHLVAAGQHEAWGNRFYRRSAVGPTSIPEVRPDVGSLGGAPQPWGSVDWIESYAGFENESPSNNAFIRKDDQLHFVESVP